jgi:hypothetical protein
MFEPVLDEQIQIVPLVQDLASNVRIERHQPPRLTVFLRDELLIQSCDLDVDVEGGKIEIGCESLRRGAGSVPLDFEAGRLVLPGYFVEIQQLGELTLAVVGELNLLVRKWIPRYRPPAV